MSARELLVKLIEAGRKAPEGDWLTDGHQVLSEKTMKSLCWAMRGPVKEFLALAGCSRPLLVKLLAVWDLAQDVYDDCEPVSSGFFRDGTEDRGYASPIKSMDALKDALEDMEEE